MSSRFSICATLNAVWPVPGIRFVRSRDRGHGAGHVERRHGVNARMKRCSERRTCRNQRAALPMPAELLEALCCQ